MIKMSRASLASVESGDRAETEPSGRLQRLPSVSHYAQMVRSEMPESKRPADE
jgi:hypothetical protein